MNRIDNSVIERAMGNVLAYGTKITEPFNKGQDRVNNIRVMAPEYRDAIPFHFVSVIEASKELHVSGCTI